MNRVDHLVYATADVAATVDEVAAALGVQPSAGGRFEAFASMNFLVSLGDSYLEVIGPDPALGTPSMPRPFGIDELTEPRLVTWAAQVDDIDAAVERARAAGHDPGVVLPLSRVGDGGVVLEWRLTLAHEDAGGGLVPFLIDWGSSPHPSTTAAGGVSLTDLRGEHPSPETVRAALDALEVELPVWEGERPRLVARLRGAAGEVTLSG